MSGQVGSTNGPPQPLPSVRKRRAMVELRSALWSASGHASPDELRGYVEQVLAEIASDEP